MNAPAAYAAVCDDGVTLVLSGEPEAAGWSPHCASSLAHRCGPFPGRSAFMSVCLPDRLPGASAPGAFLRGSSGEPRGSSASRSAPLAHRCGPSSAASRLEAFPPSARPGGVTPSPGHPFPVTTKRAVLVDLRPSASPCRDVPCVARLIVGENSRPGGFGFRAAFVASAG